MGTFPLNSAKFRAKAGENPAHPYRVGIYAGATLFP